MFQDNNFGLLKNLRFCMQCKNGTEMAVTFSLEDLLLSVKNRGAAESGNEAKRARRSRLASISDTDHIQCHVDVHFIALFLSFLLSFFQLFTCKF